MLKTLVSSFLLVSTLSISSFSNAQAFTENQGIKLEHFNPEQFQGQWVLKEHSKALYGMKDVPSFITISNGSISSIDANIAKYSKSKDRSERLFSLKTKDAVKDSLFQLNFLDYINRFYTEENIDSKPQYQILNSSMGQLNEFVQANDSKTMVFNYYADNTNAVIVGIDVLTLFDYKAQKVFIKKDKKSFSTGLKKIRDERDFDLVNNVDFMFINESGKLFALDVISLDSILIYNVENAKVAELTRSKDPKDIKTYQNLFNKIEE